MPAMPKAKNISRQAASERVEDNAFHLILRDGSALLFLAED
jgi:hypothetical protein